VVAIGVGVDAAVGVEVDVAVSLKISSVTVDVAVGTGVAAVGDSTVTGAAGVGSFWLKPPSRRQANEVNRRIITKKSVDLWLGDLMEALLSSNRDRSVDFSPGLEDSM
jgi:hypothetical protein